MKQISLYVLLAFQANIAFSQNEKTPLLYFYKNDWSAANNMDSATYFMHKIRESDTSYVCRYYQKTGPLVRWETYKDSSLKNPHGIWAWYNGNGDIVEKPLKLTP